MDAREDWAVRMAEWYHGQGPEAASPAAVDEGADPMLELQKRIEASCERLESVGLPMPVEDKRRLGVAVKQPPEEPQADPRTRHRTPVGPLGKLPKGMSDKFDKFLNQLKDDLVADLLRKLDAASKSADKSPAADEATRELFENVERERKKIDALSEFLLHGTPLPSDLAGGKRGKLSSRRQSAPSAEARVSAGGRSQQQELLPLLDEIERAIVRLSDEQPAGEAKGGGRQVLAPAALPEVLPRQRGGGGRGKQRSLARELAAKKHAFDAEIERLSSCPSVPTMTPRNQHASPPVLTQRAPNAFETSSSHSGGASTSSCPPPTNRRAVAREPHSATQHLYGRAVPPPPPGPPPANPYFPPYPVPAQGNSRRGSCDGSYYGGQPPPPPFAHPAWGPAARGVQQQQQQQQQQQRHPQQQHPEDDIASYYRRPSARSYQSEGPHRPPPPPPPFAHPAWGPAARGVPQQQQQQQQHPQQQHPEDDIASYYRRPSARSYQSEGPHRPPPYPAWTKRHAVMHPPPHPQDYFYDDEYEGSNWEVEETEMTIY
ncbi:hypothetical protein DIPPA_11217 [Diplonema papillatum]|nr:hypothetical protein DIPPA_11217 [Diplonema papillatum]